MKISFIGDVHIGEGQSLGKNDPNTGLPLRLADFFKTLDQAIDYTIANCQIAVFVGDVFHTRQPASIQQKEFGKRLSRLQQANIPVHLVVGNHDFVKGYGSIVHTMSLLEEIKSPNVTVYSNPGTLITEDFSIGFIPYMDKSRMDIPDYKGASNLYFDRYINPIWQKVKDTKGPKILVGHQTIEGSTLSSGQETDLYLLNELQIKQDHLTNFDLVIYGHIHKAQFLKMQPPIIVPGSIDRGNFGEASDEKSFIVYDTKDSSLHLEPLKVRDFIQIEVDCRDSLNPNELIRTAIAKTDLANSIIKLVVDIKRSEAHLISEELINSIQNSSLHCIYNQRTELDKERIRNITINETITPYKALEEFFANRDDLSEIKEDILNEARSIIENLSIGK